MNAGRHLSEADLAALESDLQTALALHQSNQLNEARQYYRAVLDKNHQHGLASLNLGALLIRCGALEEGASLLQQAATGAVAERNTDVLLFVGNILCSGGRLIEARTHFRQVLEIDPDHVAAHCNLAVTLDKLGKHEEAEQHYRRALQIQPDYSYALDNLGILLRQQQRLQESEQLCRRALQIDPASPQCHYNLGLVLKEDERLREAEACFRSALQINPDFSDARSNLGAVLTDQGRLTEAEACYRQVIRHTPNSAMARFSLGLVLLASGRYAEGWAMHECRWQGGKNKSRYPATRLAQWLGQPPQPGQAILIFEEQGCGDRIQFARYLHHLSAPFGRNVSMVVDRSLIGLLRRAFPACTFLESVPTDQQRWQWQCPLMSLPLACQRIDSSISGAPYLIPDPQRVARYQNKIAQLDLPAATRKIGIVWKSNSAMSTAIRRSLSFHQITALFGQPNTAWFSLQIDPDQTSSALIDWSADFNDFDATAALIANLDLIIAIDTSVAHLAGALGKPVWLLNRHCSEWRWMQGRENSPWYDSMRIFNQGSDEPWEEVLRRVAIALAAH